MFHGYLYLDSMDCGSIYALAFCTGIKIILCGINLKKMKKGIHPENYRLVAFKDMSNDTVFVTRSCAETKETLVVDGVEYPVVKVEISNTSHPFYTGKVKLVDTAGRVDKFYQRYKNRQK
mgnify:CR=1 FL=1